MPKIVPPCPVCGRKMPDDKKSRSDDDGTVTRIRLCGCGYVRIETVRKEIKECFPTK